MPVIMHHVLPGHGDEKLIVSCMILLKRAGEALGGRDEDIQLCHIFLVGTVEADGGKRRDATFGDRLPN
jgi:hypothetical protein